MQEIVNACGDVLRLIFEAPGFMSCTAVLKEPTKDGHRKVALRPVQVKDKSYQITLTGGLAAEVSNHGRVAARERMETFFDLASDIHVHTATVDVHVSVTKKGRVLVTRNKPLNRFAEEEKAHDRVKDYPLRRFDSALLLRVLGFADSRDTLLPSMQAKYRQVNEFVRILDALLPETSEKPFQLLDVGCGKAYLSFAVQAYATAMRPYPVRLTGVDVREDIVATCRETAERLGLSTDQAHFVTADVSTFTPDIRPDVVFSLHACDTATDEAIARGVEWQSPAIVVVPCCQHEIQKELKMTGAQRGLLRHGILRERVADILADAFRSQILRIMGYRVSVIEFVDPEATGRNIMIRAERGVRPGTREAVDEYAELKAAWNVTPYLERRLDIQQTKT